MSRKGHPVPRSMALGFILLGLVTLLRAQNAPAADDAQSPYHQALFDYKSGHYDDARVAIDEAEKAKPSDLPTEILKARILTELGDFDGGEKVLRPLLTPDGPLEVQLALGDLLLRKRSFNSASKFYDLALQAKPDDPDITLKMIYSRVGASDLLTAAKYASRLKPFDPAVDPLDPKHPGKPSYYFAKAALAQATGKSQEAEDDIQTARTFYGITVTNRYLKTYLEVFASSETAPVSDMTPPPLIKAAPSGAKP